VWFVTERASDDFRVKVPPRYTPTDAALLANGDVLLMLKKFVKGLHILLVQISTNKIKPGASIETSELAHFESPMYFDNMEGLDTVVLPDGNTRIYMISDDNFQPDQRNILMVFDFPRTSDSSK
jgi:hypothetical protein